MRNKKKQKERKSTTGWVYGFFNGQTHSEGYCTDGQCFLDNQQSFSTTSFIPPMDTTPHIEANNSTSITHFLESIKFAKLFPPKLIQLIMDAAAKGFLTSILLTLTNEGVSDYLRGLNYHSNHIYWINQVIRTLLLIALGSSANSTLSTLMSGYILHAYCGLSKENATYISTGMSLGINLLGKATNLIDASVAISTSIGSSLLGGQITKFGYHYVRDTFFSDETQENEADFESSSISNSH